MLTICADLTGNCFWKGCGHPLNTGGLDEGGFAWKIANNWQSQLCLPSSLLNSNIYPINCNSNSAKLGIIRNVLHCKLQSQCDRHKRDQSLFELNILIRQVIRYSNFCHPTGPNVSKNCREIEPWETWPGKARIVKLSWWTFRSVLMLVAFSQWNCVPFLDGRES